MLQDDRLSKSYGRRTVLNDVSFAAADGEITGLLGPNGAGKSTVLHIVTGLLAAASGTVRIGGDAVGTEAYRRRVGFCPDDLPQPELLTAREYLHLVQGIRGTQVGDDTLHLLAAGLRLERAMDQLIASYSHGMKRKLQLIAAVLHRPRLLVLDEPFRGLDPESGAIMRRLLREYAAAGNAVLVSTHDLLLAEQMCESVVVLRDGEVVLEGDVAGLHAAQEESLERTFLAATGLDESSRDSAEIFFEGLARIGAPS